MRITCLIFLLVVSTVTDAQQTDKPCRTNVELDVVIDTIFWTRDSIKQDKKESPLTFVDYSGDCRPCYMLRPLLPKYTVVSFTLITQTDEYIAEIPVQGNYLSYRALSEIRMAKKGEAIYFECIKARHENGNIYTLKNFSVMQ
jgi:hypothetical protein